MKEKIKVIVLLIIFILLLVVINKVLDGQNTSNINDNIENEIVDNQDEDIVSNDNINQDENIVSNDNINQDENIVSDSANQNEILDSNENSVQNATSNETNIGKVIEVTESTFDEEVLKSDKTVLVDFYADWCGPCKLLSPVVEEVAKENPNLKVVKIDVDANENLSYEYRTYSIPTLVVIKNGKEVNRSVGVISKSDILELVK